MGQYIILYYILQSMRNISSVENNKLIVATSKHQEV